MNSLRSLENDISLDDFIDLIYDAQQALDQTSVDSGGNASQQSVEEKQQDVEPKPSIPSTGSRVPASKPPLPLLPAAGTYISLLLSLTYIRASRRPH